MGVIALTSGLLAMMLDVWLFQLAFGVLAVVGFGLALVALIYGDEFMFLQTRQIAKRDAGMRSMDGLIDE